jgi:hypothetical protein
VFVPGGAERARGGAVVAAASARAGAALVALLAVGLFLLVELRHLDVVPRVYEDEPWQASTAYKLLRDGVFGSDLFAGLAHMDERYYGFMPLHPLLLAVDFKLLGVGLAQARLETVACGALTLALTIALGARLFGLWVGALAAVWLVFVRWTGLTYIQPTGIPLVDLARIARYDPLVPVFGLASLHVYLWARSTGDRVGSRPRGVVSPPGRARRTREIALDVLAGCLAGLAGLAHLYGLFWIPALMLLAVWDGHRRALGWLALGSVLPWLPYAAYVLADLPDWRAQTAVYADRFGLLDWRWYLDNLLQEYRRYGPGLGPMGASVIARVGFWSTLVGLPLAVAALLWRAVRHADAAARVVVVPALLFPVLFALLIRLKLVNYTLTELPLFAIAIGWGAVALWQRLGAAAQGTPGVTVDGDAGQPAPNTAGGDAGEPEGVTATGDGRVTPRRYTRGRAAGGWPTGGGATSRLTIWARPALAALVLAVVVEGSVRLATLEAASASTTPYAAFSARVRQDLPPGARVLGLHTYWFGLEDVDYRSFLVPLTLADPRSQAQPVPLDEALDRVAPDVVLLDARLRDYFAGDGAPDGARFSAWLRTHDAALVDRWDDPTYGLTEIYRTQR